MFSSGGPSVRFLTKYDGEVSEPLVAWVGEIPWKRVWHPIPVLLLGESPRTEEPGGLQSMGRKESDTSKQLSTAHVMPD